MSGSDNGSSAYLTSPSYSRPTSKANSVEMDKSVLARVECTGTDTLNVLFLGETNIGGCSIIDLFAGSGEQKRSSFLTSPRAPRGVRSVTLDGITFKLHAALTSGFSSTDALRKGIQNTMTVLRRSGGIHLLAYCINASHSTLWIREIHGTIAPFSTSIPVVAVIGGVAGVDQQESWWSRNKDVLTKEGPHFNGHAFIQMSAQSPTGDHISKSRHDLQTLIRQNYTLDSAARGGLHRPIPYRKRSIASSLHSLLISSAGKTPSLTFSSTKAIDIVLLGAIGVGKSSLINLIARENIADVSSDLIACTRATAKYTFEEEGRTFHLHDTPGLVDPQMGVQDFVDPVVAITEQIRSLGNGNGPDLLLFCVDNSKPTTALRRNYRLFCKIICEGRVPFALAITKLKEDQDADQWWHQHSATMRKYGINCSGHIGFGCQKHSDVNPDLEGQSRDSLLSFFVTHTSGRKNGTGSVRSSIGRAFGLAPAFRLEKTLINQCELEGQTARELANRLNSSKQPCIDGACA